jgi:hypothetical protein
MKYEMGEMTEHEVVTFFQGLIDNDLAWTLQGSYGRTAEFLINQGLCVPKGQLPKNEEA